MTTTTEEKVYPQEFATRNPSPRVMRALERAVIASSKMQAETMRKAEELRKQKAAQAKQE